MSFNLNTFHEQFPDEESCVDWLIRQRWGDEPVCPKCGALGAYRIRSRHILACKHCRKQYSVRVGTVFEDSPIPLKDWFLAVFLATNLKKGISSVKLAEFCEVTQTTAWYMLHRIRHAVGGTSGMLKGIVEVDETYIGGRRKGKRGRGAEGKTPVTGMVERGGKARIEVVPNVKRASLFPPIQRNIERGSTVMTDELASYKALPALGYGHESVSHAKGEYVRGNISVNGCENFWKHFKKGIEAIYIHVSKKHLQKYCDEFAFRFNQRDKKDSERFEAWFGQCGKRLTLKGLVGKKA